MTTTLADNTAIVLHMVESVWNLGDLDAADTMFSANYVNHGGLIIDVIKGPEAIKMTIALFKSAFPNFQITIDDHFAQESKVIVRWTARKESHIVSLSAPIVWIPGSLTGYVIFELAGGMITQSWVRWDPERDIANSELNGLIQMNDIQE